MEGQPQAGVFTAPREVPLWRDNQLSPAERAAALIRLMTLEEKVAQLAGVWVGADASGAGVAPSHVDKAAARPWSTVIRHGLGQLTRPFGTAPVDPVAAARSVAAAQAQIMAGSRFGIPAQVHEECLVGFCAWRATVYPTPLSWGAAFDPELVEEMAGRIGRSMRTAGVHQGLAPVLDVTFDYRWGVVADYFAIRFLYSLHGVAAGPPEAAGMALRAGIDVELPTVETFGDTMVEAVRSGTIDEALVDRAVARVLTQKAELGLLDEAWRPEPDDVAELCLDDEDSQQVALRLAREAVVVIRNADAILPLAAGRRVALVGPVADDPMAMLGCYAFPTHVGAHHPGHGLGVEVSSLREALGKLIPGLAFAPGCAITGNDRSGIEAAAAVAADNDVCVLAVGDKAGMFGRGTSGEGSDAADLRLPGVQSELVDAVLATGTPVIVVVLAGRPYALGAAADAAAGVVYSFLPGQLGGQAVAEVITGAVNPSGRLPVTVLRHSGGLPTTYLSPKLGHRTDVSSVDPTPAFPFGHGLSYTTFEWTGAGVTGTDVWPVDGEVSVQVTIRNAGMRPGTEVVQLYLHDPVAQTTRPLVFLIGFRRVPLEPGEAARVTFTVPADLTSFTGVNGRRIVEPGDVELRFGRSSRDIAATVPLRLTGAVREVGPDRRLQPTVRVEKALP